MSVPTREEAIESLATRIAQELANSYKFLPDQEDIEFVAALLRSSDAFKDAGEPVGRVETGVVQFGDDWPGVFVRGDDAAYYAGAIDEDDPDLRAAYLGQLRDLFLSANVRHPDHAPLRIPLYRKAP